MVTDEQSPGLQRLLWSTDTELALALVDGHRRIVYLGFDPEESSFPLHVAFPLFLSESLAWLYPRENRFSPSQVIAGTRFTVMVPPHQTEVIVTDPQGGTVAYQADAGRATINRTSQAGFYQYQSGDSLRNFAVNLTSLRESNISVRAVLAPRLTPSRSTRDLGRTAINVWPYFAGLALLALTLEWWLWCGRPSRA